MESFKKIRAKRVSFSTIPDSTKAHRRNFGGF